MSRLSELRKASGLERLRRLNSAVHRHPRVCEALVVACTLCVIFWTFLGRFLDGEHSAAAWPDNTHFILPLFAHISRSFAAGEFPYWINSIAGGIPLYNTPQFSLLYPFYFFSWNLYRTPIDTLMHVHYVTLVHVGILWINTYIMMRILRLRIISSVLAATLFAFGANTYSYLFWVNIISPYSWLPLVLGSIYLILENEHPRTGLVLGWLSIYLLVSASPAQPLIHLVYCAGFFALAYWTIHRKDRTNRRASVRNLILLTAGSILLSAANLIPTVLFSTRHMMRWTALGPIIGNQRLPFQALLTGQTNARELAKVFFPLNIEQVIGDSYLGVLPVFLLLFSIFKAKRHWIVAPLFLLALYTLLSSTGANLGLAYINYVIPLWNKIREPGRHLYVFALAACTLVAFGFEHLIEWNEAPRKFARRKHALVFSAFLVLLMGSYWVRRGYETLIGDSTLLWSFLAFLVLLAGSRLVPRVNGLRNGLLAAIVIFPSLHYPVPIVRISEGDYFMEDNLRSHRVLQEVAKIHDVRDYRLIIADKKFSTQFWSMNASYYGLRTFQAFMNPLPTQAQEMFLAPDIPHYSQLLGAKYYLSCTDPSSAPNDYSFEREIEGCRLYSTNQARPYYFLSSGIGGSYKDWQQFLDSMQQSDADLSTVWVQSKDTPEISSWLGDARQPVILEKFQEQRSQNSFSLVLKTNRRSVLVLNESFRSEWKVSVNGKNQKPFKVNLNQIAVLLPEGANQVRFEYRPSLFLFLVYVQKGLLGVIAAGLLAKTFRTVVSSRNGLSDVK